jgi:hypothetical protein
MSPSLGLSRLQDAMILERADSSSQTDFPG